jgi:hypothetical protein
MQQTVVVPPPPSPPPPPDAVASQTAVRIGDALVPLPRTGEEVQGLRNKAELIREQMQQTTSRRDDLARELRNGMADEAKSGVQQRIAVLDEQILQMERDQAAIERALINAPPELLAETQVYINEVDTSGMVDEDEAFGWGFFAFGLGMVLTMVGSRIRRRIARKRAPTQGNGFVPADPRIDKLAEAVDAIAEEVERIGEGQRFVTNLLADRREPVIAGRPNLQD